jgi:hypothetical protein
MFKMKQPRPRKPLQAIKITNHTKVPVEAVSEPQQPKTSEK